VILLDTSGLLAWIDSSQRHHQAVVSVMDGTDPPYLLSPFVLAELDYLLATRVGPAAQHALLREVERGAFSLAPVVAEDVGRALTIMARYADLDIGLADASIVVLAERHDASTVLTLDERHFRTLQAPGPRAFRLLPADS
jgi:uncharacterized protein